MILSCDWRAGGPGCGKPARWLVGSLDLADDRVLYVCGRHLNVACESLACSPRPGQAELGTIMVSPLPQAAHRKVQEPGKCS